MDTSIIGVALPEMQAHLGFAPQGLSWVFNGYVVAFGGLLLLGGRLSDLFGARRIFTVGWAVLGVGSLLAGLAGSIPAELAGIVEGTNLTPPGPARTPRRGHRLGRTAPPCRRRRRRGAGESA